MGFGTGLNAFLTAKHNLELGKTIFYHGVEAYPVNSIELEALGYNKLLGDDYEQLYTKIHKVKWDDIQWINERLSLLKSEDRLQELELKSFFYDVIYYDAFGPRAQDEMWSIELFEKMYKCLQKGGFLVTYCAKGQVKRNMKAVGFEIEPLPGPPGKREMTRAWKR
jgi:tRNA U34 5-methylaminomethyl-2-thiouridine-forming methyltransferase MnmC